MRPVLLTIGFASVLGLPVAVLCEEAADAALGVPVSIETLESLRGGDQTHNVIRITGQVTDNTAHDVTTGANDIQGGSFANSSGINSVVQNTGANVLIQAATIVNVEFAEP
jgi:hypothetical protein